MPSAIAGAMLLPPGDPRIAQYQESLALSNPEHRQWAKRMTEAHERGRKFYEAEPEPMISPVGEMDDGPWKGGGVVPRCAPGVEGKDSMVMPLAEKLTFNGESRDYQSEASDNFLRHGGTSTIQAPCGAGKSVIGCQLTTMLDTPALVLVHTRDLAVQWQREIERFTGVKAPVVGYGKAGDGSGARIAVASMQTLATWGWWRIHQWGRQWGFVVQDECFPAGTMVGDVPIESLTVGAIVPSFDEATGGFVDARVTKVMRTKPSAMVMVTIAGEATPVTTGHPYYTRRGWVVASDLRQQDEVAYAWNDDLDNVHAVRSDAYVEPRTEPSPSQSVQADRTRLLRQDLLKGVQDSILSTEHAGTLGRVACLFGERFVGAHEGKESDAHGWRDPEDVADARPLQADSARWEWTRANQTADHAGEGHRSVDGGDRHDWPGCAPTVLQPGSGGLGPVAGSGGGWAHSSGEAARSGSAERCILAFARVDSVEVLERGSDGSFGGVCRDGFVYNIEVEGTHTYLVGRGRFVVHNCHHAPSRTMTEVLSGLSGRWRLGLTATPKRADGLTPWLRMLLGPTVAQISPTMLENLGRTLAPEIRVMEMPPSLVVGFDELASHERDRALADDAVRNQMVVNEIRKCVLEGRRTLVLVKLVEHAQRLADWMKESGLDAVSLTGDMPKKLRGQSIDRMRAGTVEVVTATSLADEGLDAPRLDTLFMLQPCGDMGKIEQRIGRVARPHPEALSPRVYDIVDAWGPYRGYAKRRYNLYRSRGWL